MAKLSIIIINYHSADLAIACLHTLYAETTAITFEVIIVDNNSKDYSKEKILAAYPGVKWIQMNYNSGFARANNEGIRQSKGDVVLLLNADTLIKNNAIGKCYGYFMASPFAACGVQLLNADLTPQISGSYFMKGGLNCLLPLPYLGNFIKNCAGLAGVKKPHVPDSNSTIEVDWINGAYLMVKKSAIEKAGLLNEDFFLYAEEAEWCSRLKKAGPLCIFGDLKVIHLQGETANKTYNSTGKGYYNLYDKKGLQMMISNFVRIRKQFGAGWFLINFLVYIFDIPVFFIGLLLSKIFFGKKASYSFSQFKGYCKNIFYVIKRSPNILKNAPFFYKVL